MISTIHRKLRFIDSLIISVINFIALLYISLLGGVEATAFLALISSSYLVFFSFIRQNHLNEIIFEEYNDSYFNKIITIYLILLVFIFFVLAILYFLKFNFLSIFVFFLGVSLNSEFGRLLSRDDRPSLFRVSISLFSLFLLVFCFLIRFENYELILNVIFALSFSFIFYRSFKKNHLKNINFDLFEFIKKFSSSSNLTFTFSQLITIHLPVFYLYFYSKGILAFFYIGRSVFQGVQLYLKSMEFEIVNFVNANKWCWDFYKKSILNLLFFSLIYYFALICFLYIDKLYFGLLSSLLVFDYGVVFGLFFWGVIFQLISAVRPFEFYYFKRMDSKVLFVSSIFFTFIYILCSLLVFNIEFSDFIKASFPYLISYSLYVFSVIFFSKNKNTFL